MALLVLVIAALVSIEVDGGDACLDAAALQGELHALSPGTRGRVSLEAGIDRVRIELRDEAGELVARREVPRARDCAELRRLITVLIASWETPVHPPEEAPLALPPQPQSQLLPQLSLGLTAPRPRRALAWEVDAAALGSIAGGTFAVGATADVLLAQRGFPLGVRLGVAAMDTRDLTLGSGRASWGRVAATISPSVQVLARVVRLELHADAILGWLFMRGVGFSSNATANAFDGALGGGARLSIERWSVTPWLDASVLGWLAHQNATAMDAGQLASAQIPRFDVWLRIGIAYGRR